MLSSSDFQALEDNEFEFNVALDTDYYGPEATQDDIDSYAHFAREHLTEQSGEEVAINYVQRYERNDPQYDLRQETWEAFCRSTH